MICTVSSLSEGRSGRQLTDSLRAVLRAQRASGAPPAPSHLLPPGAPVPARGSSSSPRGCWVLSRLRTTLEFSVYHPPRALRARESKLHLECVTPGRGGLLRLCWSHTMSALPLASIFNTSMEQARAGQKVPPKVDCCMVSVRQRGDAAEQGSESSRPLTQAPAFKGRGP